MASSEEITALISTFTLNEALFGIDTANVQEIVPCGQVTPVHRAPAYIRGVINLRGQIFTVVDLARRLGFTRASGEPVDGPEGYIIIVSWQHEHIGLLVEQVSDVIPFEREALQPLPANLSSLQREYIRGIYQTAYRPAAVLDVDSVLAVRAGDSA